MADDFSQFGTVTPSDWSKYGKMNPAGPVDWEDVGKSISSGLAKGGIGVAGMPGDVAELATKGANYFGVNRAPETQDAPPGTRMVVPRPDLNLHLPRSSELRKGLEEITGPLHEPQTPLGHIAGTVSEFVPGAVALGGGPSVMNTAKYALAPGVASELAGVATQGSEMEPYARGGAALAAGGLTSALSRPATPERIIRAQMPKYINDQHILHAQNLIDDAKQRGITLTWPEALSQATGKPVLTDIQRLLESSRRTRATMSDVLGNRAPEIEAAGRSEAATIGPQSGYPATIGPAVGKAAEGTINDVRDIINKRTEPYYQQAEGVLLTPQEMAQVRSIPGYSQARNVVRNDPQLNRNVAHLPDNSIGFLNEVKKYFDQAAENAASPVQQQHNMQRASGFGKSAQATKQAAIDAGNRAFPGGPNPYEVALNVQAQTRQTFLEPLLQGPLGQLAKSDITTQRAIDALFPKNPLLASEGQITDAVSAMAKRNPGATAMLVRAHVESELEKAFNAVGRDPANAGTAGAQFAKQIAGNPLIETQRLKNLRAAVEALPGHGQVAWDGFEKFLKVLQATSYRQGIGSKTAFNMADLHALETGGVAGSILKEVASPGEWFHLAKDLWGRWQAGSNLDKLATIITDPRSGPVFKRIADMPPGSRQAQLLTARLVAIGNTARQPAEKPKETNQ